MNKGGAHKVSHFACVCVVFVNAYVFACVNVVASDDESSVVDNSSNISDIASADAEMYNTALDDDVRFNSLWKDKSANGSHVTKAKYLRIIAVTFTHTFKFYRRHMTVIRP